MEININQNKIAIGDKYNIFINYKEKYRASSQVFSVFPEIQLIDLDNKEIRLIINRKPSCFKPRYSFTLWDDKSCEFKSQSFWKPHYQCIFNSSVYDVFGHTGLKYSIYKDNIQVAWWDKASVTWFNGDNYKIIADDDCDLEMIIGFCLAFDNLQDNNDNSTVTFDAGNIGPQARKFMPDWKPKIS